MHINIVILELSDSEISEKITAVLYSHACLRHLVPKWHFERPERLQEIMEGIQALQSRYPRTLRIVEDFAPVSSQVVSLVHDRHYLSTLENCCPSKDYIVEHLVQCISNADSYDQEDFDTFMSRDSLFAARMACGAVCKAIDLVVAGSIRNAFCAIRPPGHHCGEQGHTKMAATQGFLPVLTKPFSSLLLSSLFLFEGYCILNNIAIGAVYARFKYDFTRIAVVDFDVHHGNGTEEILGGLENFLFASIHVGSIYPKTGRDGLPRKKNVINVSLNPFANSKVFHDAFNSKIISELEKYQPEFLLISAGFDGHKKDPTENGMRLVEKDFFLMTDKLREIADRFCEGRMVSALEGGYHLPSLHRCVAEHIVGLMKTTPRL